MSRMLVKCLVSLGMALVAIAPPAIADTFTLTNVNPSGANLGGVYTGPYVATINGVPNIQVICDDFATTTYLNQTLNVTETRVSELASPSPNQTVKFTRADGVQQQNNYMTAAYLAIQMIGVDQSSAAGQMQAGLLNYAIWGLFTPSAFTRLNLLEQAAAMQYLADAQAAIVGQTVGMYANVSIWTPNPNGAAQEFLSVTVTEPAAAAMLLFNLLAVLGFGLFVRRRNDGLVQ